MKNRGSLRRIGIILMMALLLLQAVPVMAEDAGEQKIVRVAAGITNALYLDADGKAQGYCASYLKQIAWLENWKLEYVEGTWNESVQRLYDGEIDILLPTQMTEERKLTMGYSKYIGGYEAVGLYAGDDTDICFNDYENIDQKVIGAEKNTSDLGALKQFASDHYLTYTLVEMEDMDQLSQAMEDGTIDMIVCNTTNEVEQAKLVAVVDYLPFYYCTAIDNTELLAELNDGMRNIMINSPDMTTKVFDTVMKGTTEVGYTKEEAEIIANTDKIVVGMYDDCLPLSGSDANGNAIGLYVDLLKKLEDYIGVKVEPYLISTDEFLYDYLDRGTVDYVMSSKNLAYVSENVNSYLGSDNITDYYLVAVTRPGYELDKQKDTVFAVTNYSSYLEDMVREDYPKATFQYYSNVKECLTAVQKKEVDAAYVNSWEYNYQTKNARFQDMTEWENTRIRSDLIVATLVKTDVSGLAIMDKAINQLPSDMKDKLIASNLNMSYISNDDADKWYTMRQGLTLYGGIIFMLLIIFAVYIFMRRENEKSLKAKNQELELANKAKSDFLSRMSHELRTPINAIAGYTNLLEEYVLTENWDKEQFLKNTETTRRATGYLLAIISDLLDIQSIEAGKIQIMPEKVNADEYMQNVVDMVKQEAAEKEIDFSYERLTHFSDLYLLDGVRFQQILLNVLHNAIKFTPKGGMVRMTAEGIEQDAENTKIEFVIEDNGIGMSNEFRENELFKKFAQENGDISSPYDGCGTGLALCKQLLDLMGGTIRCESEKGVGTTFVIDVTVKHVRRRRRRAAVNEQVTYDFSGTRVLLCEDNQMNQDMEKRVLERMKCQVEIAEDGQIGLEKYQQSPQQYYQIILMDIRMPNLDGWEATRRIRQLEREDAKTIPILAVSANAFEEDVKQSLEAGMNEHLAKPVDARILGEKIAQYCKGKD